MPANSVLQNKIDQLYDWLVDNASRIDPDDKDQSFDALVTLQKESLGALLANAPLPDINAAVRAIDDAIDGINNETKKLAAISQVVGWIAAAASLIEKALTSGIPL